LGFGYNKNLNSLILEKYNFANAGITAIELADGKAPFENIHPTRALFQIVSNPPPTLYRPASWTQLLNDFINE
jgi:hypothetical protein